MLNRVNQVHRNMPSSMLNSSGYAGQKMVKTMPFLRQVPIRNIIFEIFRSCTEIEIINHGISILFKIKNLNEPPSELRTIRFIRNGPLTLQGCERHAKRWGPHPKRCPRKSCPQA